MSKWLKGIWCRLFHRYTGHLGFQSRGKIEWMCCQCGHEFVTPSRPDKARANPTTGR